MFLLYIMDVEIVVEEFTTLTQDGSLQPILLGYWKILNQVSKVCLDLLRKNMYSFILLYYHCIIFLEGEKGEIKWKERRLLIKPFNMLFSQSRRSFYYFFDINIPFTYVDNFWRNKKSQVAKAQQIFFRGIGTPNLKLYNDMACSGHFVSPLPCLCLSGTWGKPQVCFGMRYSYNVSCPQNSLPSVLR